MYNRIMVGFDGSPGAEAALTHAAMLASETGAHLSALLATPSSSICRKAHGLHLWLTGANRTESELKKKAVILAANQQVAIGWDVEVGHSAEQLINQAVKERVDLMALGSHGGLGTKRHLLGGTVDRIAHHAPCDLLIVHRRSDSGPYRKILVGYDGSVTARQALYRAVSLAGRLRATVRVLRVCETLPHHSNVEAREQKQLLAANRFFQSTIRHHVNAVAFEHLIRIDADFLLGNPASVLVEETKEKGVDLIVMGRSGHNALYDKLLGGTADRVSHTAPCDVLLIRGPDL